ncbi:response regulator [Anditalea andensis]|uniref:Response regulatory domain-containing protein n=1 Tax=Anditalea andensis TaxID=1048983 RepID=A0A074KQR2_9BACT|nr:response regulator [Anditalea andensis]KEO72286.1 hypothetical protein EL17_16170 [Anditalea andensis]
MKEESYGKILIAEDNVMTQKLLGSIISNLGHEVTMVSDGMEVLEKLTLHKYDILVLDFQMPVLNGMETLKMIENGVNVDTNMHVIMLTGETNHEKLTQFEGLGISCFLKKPIQYDILSRTIKQLLNNDQYIGVKNAASTSYLQRITNSNKDLMVELIDVFIDESPKNLHLMKSYCLIEDWVSLQKLVHKVKANYSYVGIKAHEVILGELEIFISRNLYPESYLPKIIELEIVTKNAISALKKKKSVIVNKING